MARSPVAVGLVLGLLVGGGAAAAIAATSPDEGRRASTRPEAAISQSTDPVPGSIERLAAAFDLHVPAAVDADGWVVRDGDRVLRIQRAATLPWFFSTTDRSCMLVPEAPPLSEPLQTVPPSGPTECPEETPPSGVSKEDALALGKETLARAGLRVSTTDIVDEPGGWYVQASPQVAAPPWTISIGPGRTISAASGYLAVQDR